MPVNDLRLNGEPGGSGRNRCSNEQLRASFKSMRGDGSASSANRLTIGAGLRNVGVGAGVAISGGDWLGATNVASASSLSEEDTGDGLLRNKETNDLRFFLFRVGDGGAAFEVLDSDDEDEVDRLSFSNCPGSPTTRGVGGETFLRAGRSGCGEAEAEVGAAMSPAVGRGVGGTKDGDDQSAISVALRSSDMAPERRCWCRRVRGCGEKLSGRVFGSAEG